MDEGQKKLVFIMFENEANSWLNAALSLIAHNESIKKLVESFPDSRIKDIISSYGEAMKALYKADYSTEQNIVKAKEMLLKLQNRILKYFKLFNVKISEPESAFSAVLNLIFRDNSNIKDLLNVSWIWRKHCTNCGEMTDIHLSRNPIITLNTGNFHPECPTSNYLCNCESVQEMTLVYKEIPPCLIFHFENGAGTGTYFPTSFSIKGREYKLTGIIILEKSCGFNVNRFYTNLYSVNHFYTLIRNPVDNCWLECNDLEKKCVSFSPAKPEFNLENVCMAVFEAFDNLDKINNEKSAKRSGVKKCSEETNSKILEEKDYADNKQNTQGGSSKMNGDLFKNIIHHSDDGKTRESANNKLCTQSDEATNKEMKDLDFAVSNTVLELFLQFNKPRK